MMLPDEHHHGPELRRPRNKEPMQETDKATLASSGLRAMHQEIATKGEATRARWASLVATLLVAALVIVGTGTPASATSTFAVNQASDVPDANLSDNVCDVDSGVPGEQCTLRAAIQQANYASGADAVTLPGGTYTLTRAGANEDAAYTGDLDITEELTITGAGARSTSVVGGPAPYDDRIFDNRPGVKASITGLTITGGKASDSAGGGVQNVEGALTLDKVAVTGNTAPLTGLAGGIYSQGGTQGGTLNLTDSTVSGNTATNHGGIVQYKGSANITNSTISGNKATEFSGGVSEFSGGVFVQEAFVNILNSTVANNESGRLGGGIMTGPGATVLVKDTILAGNSINNCDNDQFGGAISSLGNNISTDDSCPFTKSTDKQNTKPLLGPLQDNGGPTDTRALLAGSPAIDAAGASACPPRDQRGVARKDGDGDGTVVCDVGAFEAPTNTRPTITNPKPAPGSTTRDRTPLIAANVRDAQTDLAKTNIKLFVDGNRRDFSYDRSTDRLSFVPGSRLSLGKHAVKVVASDSVLSATKSWSFGVVRG